MAGEAEARERVRAAVESTALVDGHAHNVVDLRSSFSFLHTFSEAQRQALRDVPHTLPFKRSVDDIAGLYGTAPTLESIEEYRKAVGLNVVSTKCFDAANICTVLLDDGLSLDKMKDLSWHKKYIYGVHRVLRIETLAEDLLNQGPPHGGVTWTLNSFEERFVDALNSISSSVVAFKSIAAYRSGLFINPGVSDQAAEEGLMEELKKKKPIRLQNKNILNLLFTRALELATLKDIPMQIHTGFGDKDLDLKLANPLYLRAVLEDKRFGNSRLVLLHASYPYMRQAAYLSQVYPQVYLDFGLAIPKLSVRGMKSAVSELFELAPLNKVMFSTDGYAFPETYFLGAKWTRQILSQVLCEAYADGDLSVDDAVAAAKAILQKNALGFYKLDEDAGNYTHSAAQGLPVVSRDLGTGAGEKSWKDDVGFFRLVWADGAGLRRCRVVPKARYESVVVEAGVGLTKCAMAISSSCDGPAKNSGLSAVGEIRLVPDRSTESRVPWAADQGMVLADMHVTPGSPWEYCPRSTLRRVLGLLDKEFGLTLRAGFEIEFYLLSKTTDGKWSGVDVSNYCSTSALNQSSALLSKMVGALEALDIEVEQYHAESGCGQFEFCLAHEAGVAAADKLLLAREAIVGTAAVAASDIVATFVPKLPHDSEAAGSGCHAHLSLWKDGANIFPSGTDSNKHGMSASAQHFVAGILHHLPALLAFTSPHPLSYARIRPYTWSGAFQVWGRDNKEAPLRTCSPPGAAAGAVTNVEVKSLDGCANPHLGLAALAAAGLDGLRKRMALPDPTEVDPAELEPGEVARLPTKPSEAVAALKEDKELRELMGEALVTAISAIRLADEEYYLRRSKANTIHLY